MAGGDSSGTLTEPAGAGAAVPCACVEGRLTVAAGSSLFSKGNAGEACAMAGSVLSEDRRPSPWNPQYHPAPATIANNVIAPTSVLLFWLGELLTGFCSRPGWEGRT